MQLYREWAPSVQGRKGLMRRAEDFSKLAELHDPGYSSLYMFKEVDALEVLERGNSQGLDQYEVGSDRLVIDIDSGFAGLEQAVEILDQLNLSYTVWSSGGKGYHIVLDHDLIISKSLPYSHRKLVESWGIEADFTLYQHGRLLSLPNRLHRATKKRKQAIFTVKANRLEVPLLQAPDKPVFDFNAQNGLDELGYSLLKLAELAVKSPKEGSRHTLIWGMAKDLCRSGLSFETTVELLIKVNDSWPLPKTHAEVQNAVTQAYQSMGER